MKNLQMPREIHPSSMAWLQTAQAYSLYAKGKPKAARMYLERAEKLDPEHHGILLIREELFPDE